MKDKMWKAIGLTGFCAALSMTAPVSGHAAEIAVETSTVMYASLYEELPVREEAFHTSKIITTAAKGESYEVAEPGEKGWIKIKTQEGDGYIQDSGAALMEKTKEKADKSARIRKEVVNYALQFKGKPYVYGGVNPNTGVDCSGFTRYVLQNSAGVALSRSSRTQAGEGIKISYEEARPGDLVFYARNGTINHVALYMGDGQVVHASTEKTGIIVSPVMYRSPVKFISVLN